MALLAVVVSFALTSPAARGASNLSPDPSPQAAPATSGGSPAPDPAPQAAPAARPTQSASASQSPAPVVPRPTASGIGVGSTSTSGGSTVTTANPVIQPSPPVRRHIRRAVHRVRRPAVWVADVARQVTAPWHQNPLLSAAGATSQPTASARNGLLLLLGAAALAVLALASGSMLRLLRRMDGVRLP